MSPQVHRTLVIVWLAVALAPTPASSFEVFRHRNMTSEVLGRVGVPATTLRFILQGVVWPDINQCTENCYCPSYLTWSFRDSCPPNPARIPFYSAFHFDNNRLAEGIERVNVQMDAARNGIVAVGLPITDANRRDAELAWLRFGIAVHAIQDFYAHSTWMEINRDLVRIGGRIESLPLWNGEQLGGSVNIGGTTISGVQTGFFGETAPAGSVTHDQLNKDAPGTPQGAIVVNRIFPAGRIGSQYEIVSGQVGGTGAGYLDSGVAPRHTLKAWMCLRANCVIYNSGGLAARTTQPYTDQQVAAAIDDLIAALEADPQAQADAARMDSLISSADPDDPATFPVNEFDAEGLLIPPSSAVDPATLGDSKLHAAPNPARGQALLRFVLAEDANAKLAVYDMQGRHVRTLLSGATTRGWHFVPWDATDERGVALRPGTYLARLEVGGQRESARFVLVR